MIKDKKNNKKCKMGFTLAEVLITLVIIGVVTALTIPSLLSNISDKTYDTKRQGFATRMAQAISQIGMLNAYEDSTNPEENSSLNFIIEALSKVYSLSATCEFENYRACDFPDVINWTGGAPFNTSTYEKLANFNNGVTAAKLGGLETKGAFFRTKNGESVLLYYNPRCIPEQIIEPDTVVEPGMAPGTKNYAKEICLNMLFDLDGAKRGPNMMGRDIGIALVLYPDTPYLIVHNASFWQYSTNKPSWSSDTTTPDATAEGFCQNNVQGVGYSKGQWTLATREEDYVLSMLHNFFWSANDNDHWTSSVEGSTGDDYGWLVNPYALTATLKSRKENGYINCTSYHNR